MPDPHVRAIPGHLSTPSRRWAEGLARDWEFSETEWRLVVLAAEAFDRSQTARRTLQREGLTTLDFRGSPKPRPEVQIARESAALFAAALVKQLGIADADDQEQPRVTRGRFGPRTPRGHGRVADAKAAV